MTNQPQLHIGDLVEVTIQTTIGPLVRTGDVSELYEVDGRPYCQAIERGLDRPIGFYLDVESVTYRIVR